MLIFTPGKLFMETFLDALMRPWASGSGIGVEPLRFENLLALTPRGMLRTGIGWHPRVSRGDSG